MACNMRFQNAMRWASLLFIAYYIVIGPTLGFHLSDARYDDQRIAQVILIGLIGLLVLSRLLVDLFARSMRSISVYSILNISSFSATSNLLLIIAIIGFISAILSDYVAESIVDWAIWILLGTLSYSIAVSNISKEKLLYYVQVTLLVVLTLYFVLVLVNFAAQLSALRTYSNAFLWMVGFENPRFLSAFAVLLFPLLFSLLSDKKFSRFKVLVYLLAGFCLLSCVLVRSRGSLLFLLGATLALLFFDRSVIRKWLRFCMISAIFGLVLTLLLFVLPAQLGWEVKLINFYDSIEGLAKLSSREILWKISLHHIEFSPLLGIGPGQFAAYPNGIGAHPHNVYLQFWTEWGSLVFVMLFWLIFGSLRTFLTAIKSKIATGEHSLEEKMMIALWAIFGGLIPYSLVDGLWTYPYLQTVLAVCIGLGIKLTNGNSTAHDAPNMSSNSSRYHSVWMGSIKLTLVVILLSCVCILVRFIPPQIPNLVHHEEYFMTNSPVKNLNPRLWRQGWLNLDQKQVVHPAEKK